MNGVGYSKLTPPPGLRGVSSYRKVIDKGLITEDEYFNNLREVMIDYQSKKAVSP